MSNFCKSLLVVGSLFFAAQTSFAKGVSSSWSGSGSPSERPFGLGVVLGVPTAIVGKYWLDQKTAIDGGVGVYFGNYTLFYGDYLLHYPGLFGHETKFVSELIPYFGFGAVLAFTSASFSDNYGLRGTSSGAFGFGGRVPGGIEWKPKDHPIGVFVEVAPGLAFVPQVGLFIQAGIGIRYYF